ncbi:MULTISPECIES: thiol:disulfide interchange protein DsbG [Dickeya]|uniref:thiol:disulfide interchange protein DsbG n=1 Tax=Dickeya TaxID=204037 RepID=UPI0005774697|nr:MULTISPECIES: thiol:disulfide interchange protein DsbG [Dickeya]MBP2851400.1 thiol:disulfide interchange protein DsbG [Dickeya oryzae]QIZ49157.1 thiol:disulfide interchange protein DsbG [Dickeya zeae]
MKYRYLLLCALLAAVSAQADTTIPPAVKQLEKQGIKIIKPFSAPGGVQGWLGEYQKMGVTIYLTPDGKHAISGYMYDAQGNNLSEQLIDKELYLPAGREMWKKLERAPWIAEGKADAPRTIVVFADPFCPYCKQFWEKAQPWVESGKVQIRTLLVGIIRPDSGRYAAAILSAKNPAQAWHDFELSNGKTVPSFPDATPPDVVKKLQYNQQLLEELGANVTPAIYYMNADNALQQVVGLPDEKQLADMMGK